MQCCGEMSQTPFPTVYKLRGKHHDETVNHTPRQTYHSTNIEQIHNRCRLAGKSIILKYFRGEIPGSNRTLNRGVIATKKIKKASTLWLSPEPPISSPYSPAHAALSSHPNIHHSPVPTVLTLTFWKSKSSALWHLHSVWHPARQWTPVTNYQHQKSHQGILWQIETLQLLLS